MRFVLRNCRLIPLAMLMALPAMLEAQEYPPAVPWPANQWDGTGPVAPEAMTPQLPPWPGQQWPTPEWSGQSPPPPYIRPLPEVLPPGEMVLPPGEEPSIPPPSADTFSWDQPVDKPAPKAWTGSVEAGMNGTAGNSENFALNAGSNFEWQGPRSKFVLQLNHNNSATNNVTTANRYLLDSRYEWQFSKKSPWELYVHSNLELDEFKAFDQRIATDMGLSYMCFSNDLHELKTRIGAGVSREIGGPDDRWIPEGILGLTYKLRVSDRQKFTTSADYFPSWEDFNDYRLKIRTDWEILLDEATHLSVKVGALDTYDSTPNGAKANDLTYTAVLLWKF